MRKGGSPVSWKAPRMAPLGCGLLITRGDFRKFIRTSRSSPPTVLCSPASCSPSSTLNPPMFFVSTPPHFLANTRSWRAHHQLRRQAVQINLRGRREVYDLFVVHRGPQWFFRYFAVVLRKYSSELDPEWEISFAVEVTSQITAVTAERLEVALLGSSVRILDAL
ncbi:hypothetical protein C8J57DRAFT_235384 [Mycena rebaudengoi]|nr:hypothetical protein C8J57DRAFT_235384 [Mycena rebaudengoi]